MRLFSPSHIVSSLRMVGLWVLLGAIFLGTTNAEVFAAYGEGVYGAGVYNTGSTSTGATDSSGSSGSSPDPKAPGCEGQPPAGVPDLFQINAQRESLTLFFTPSSGRRDRYFVSYSTEPNTYQHGFALLNSENGVISVEVKALQPDTEYYFKVRAGNGCRPGEWSNLLSAKTGQRFPTYRWHSLPRIIRTAVRRRITPSSVGKVEVQAGDTETPTATPSLKPSAPPTPQQDPPPTPQPVAGRPSEPFSSLLRRIVDFFKHLF